MKIYDNFFLSCHTYSLFNVQPIIQMFMSHHVYNWKWYFLCLYQRNVFCIKIKKEEGMCEGNFYHASAAAAATGLSSSSCGNVTHFPICCTQDYHVNLNHRLDSTFMMCMHTMYYGEGQLFSHRWNYTLPRSMPCCCCCLFCWWTSSINSIFMLIPFVGGCR